MARVSLSAGSLREFADATLDAAASATGDGPSAAFGVLDESVAVRFASHALQAAFGPAWTELPAPAGREPVTLLVLDRGAAGDPPVPPWPADAYAPRDEIEGFGDESLEVAYQLSAGTLMLWDSRARLGVWWTRSAEEIPIWERAMPLRVVLRWALRDRGVALVHGAAVGVGDRLALVVGPGGSGKSTLALAARESGWHYVSDDYCAVEPGTMRVAPVTGFAKATDGTVALVPSLSRLASSGRTPDAKRVLAVRPDPSGVVAAVVLPWVSPTDESPVRTTAARTMAALAPTSLLQMPGSRARDRDLLGDVVRAVPGYTLASGPDPAVTLRHLRGLLEDA